MDPMTTRADDGGGPRTDVFTGPHRALELNRRQKDLNMTSETVQDSGYPSLDGTREERRAERVADFDAHDPQFHNSWPISTVVDAARKPGLRLNQVIQTLVEGYTDRAALGERARELVTDPATGRTSATLLARFDTMTYGGLWERVVAIAGAWRADGIAPVNPGDFVVSVGFASSDHFTVEMVCA